MTVALNRFANGDTNYVAKHNTDAAQLEVAINGILGALGSGTTPGQYLQAIFGTSTAFIGSASYTETTAGTVFTVTAGYAWRPDLGTVLYKGSATAIDFAGQPAATYYIEIGADGTPARVSSSSFPMYSVVWTGAAFGTITKVATVVPSGDVSGNLQALTIAAGAVTLAKMANLAANSLLGNNSGSAATPIALTPAQVKTLLALAVADVLGAAPLASPPLTGTPTAPTPTGGDNSTKLATTAFVTAAIGSGAPPSGAAGGDLTGTFPNPTIAAAAVTLAKQANLAANTIQGNNTGAPATPLALTASQVKALLAIASGDVSGLAAVATSGSATDLTAGTLPVARLPAIRYDLATFFPGVPAATQLVLRWQAPRAVTIPSGATNSQASAGTAATGSTTFAVKQNGSSVGTIVWSAAGTTGAFTVSSPISLAAGDVLTITGPGTPDATLADISITLAATA